MRPWEAEVEIDEALVRGLLAEQLPELEASSARRLAEGWDNSVWVVEDRWAFRFPRRAAAVPLVERELAILPRLAPLLPTPVPVPRYRGRPGERFPWPFFGCELLPGREPADAQLSDDERVELGGQLGRFLRVLHAPATAKAVDPDGDLPVDPNRRTVAERSVIARDHVRGVEELGLWRPPGEVERLLDEASRLAPPRGPFVLAHGDLHLRHVLVDDGVLSGVIDWGDVCRADASIDLVLVWSVLPPAGRRRFLAAYGEVDGQQRVRSRVLALSLCAALARYAHDVGHPSLLREAVAGLDRTLVDRG